MQNKPEVFAASGRGDCAVPVPSNKKRIAMHPRLRKLIGTVLIIILVIVYALVATTVASLTLATSPWWVHMLYFFFTGLLWILPAMLIIKWMEKPSKPKD